MKNFVLNVAYRFMTDVFDLAAWTVSKLYGFEKQEWKGWDD